MMQLSATIREGAKHYVQGTQEPVQRSKDGRILKVCALGAAYLTISQDVAGERGWFGIYEFLEEAYPFLLSTQMKTPIGEDDETHSIEGIIIELNDYYEWTLDQIADWLESVGH